MLRGRPLLEHAIGSLLPYVGAVVVCGRDIAGTPCLADLPEPDMGPLGGLNAALHHAAANGYDGVLSLGCDMPLLPDDVARALIGNEAAIVQGQHLVGYWPTILAADLAEHLLSSENRSIRGWLDRIRPRPVFLTGQPLPNINTPLDLEALRQNWPRS